MEYHLNGGLVMLHNAAGVKALSDQDELHNCGLCNVTLLYESDAPGSSSYTRSCVARVHRPHFKYVAHFPNCLPPAECMVTWQELLLECAKFFGLIL